MGKNPPRNASFTLVNAGRQPKCAILVSHRPKRSKSRSIPRRTDTPNNVFRPKRRRDASRCALPALRWTIERALALITMFRMGNVQARGELPTIELGIRHFHERLILLPAIDKQPQQWRATEEAQPKCPARAFPGECRPLPQRPYLHGRTTI